MPKLFKLLMILSFTAACSNGDSSDPTPPPMEEEQNAPDSGNLDGTPEDDQDTGNDDDMGSDDEAENPGDENEGGEDEGGEGEGGEDEGGEEGDNETPDDSQIPPMGAAAIQEWIATGSYLNWNCESEPMLGRRGAHGANRICSNDALSTASDADPIFPVGAAGVKELYSGGEINGYAVYLKVSDSAGAESWYWYENIGTNIIADGLGNSSGNAGAVCASCHSSAAKDYVFVQVKN